MQLTVSDPSSMKKLCLEDRVGYFSGSLFCQRSEPRFPSRLL